MDVFYDIPANPRPAGAHGDFFLSKDGKRLRYAIFPAEARPLKGTVILIQGRNECIEKYFETAIDLSRRGFATATFDLRGQGGSDRLIKDGQRGYVKSFDDYARDLRTFFDDIVLPDCRGPYYIMAHSGGALIALLTAPYLVNRVQRMVLLAPLLQIAITRLQMRTVKRITSTLGLFGLGRRYIGGGPRPAVPLAFEGNKLSTDPDRFRRNIEIYVAYPQLALGGPTVSWVAAAARAVEKITDPSYMSALRIPMLFVNATADRVVDPSRIEAYAKALRLGSLVTIYGARHELLQEVDLYREQVLAAFDAFVPGSETMHIQADPVEG
ncbi:alpha/beta hydrolase [Corticibacterium sp. UT-5YL-CI-8]|nr:alpha/beta hydrolase [Tianweitania sp. UT-5YL-CI-8]